MRATEGCAPRSAKITAASPNSKRSTTRPMSSVSIRISVRPPERSGDTASAVRQRSARRRLADGENMQDHFEEVVTTRDHLRALYRMPSHRVSNKAIDHIDEICARFIAACPFVIVATRGPDGCLDLSPK